MGGGGGEGRIADLGDLSVAVRDHFDVGSITAHGLAPLPHHKDAAPHRITSASSAVEPAQLHSDPKAFTKMLGQAFQH